MQEGSKQHTIAGETKWKKHLPSTDFKKIWKNTFESYAQPFFNDLHYRLLHYSTKANVQMIKPQQLKLRPLRNHSRQLTFIYKMLKNTKNLDTLPQNTNKTNRKNLYPATTLTHSKP